MKTVWKHYSCDCKLGAEKLFKLFTIGNSYMRENSLLYLRIPNSVLFRICRFTLIRFEIQKWSDSLIHTVVYERINGMDNKGNGGESNGGGDPLASGEGDFGYRLGEGSEGESTHSVDGEPGHQHRCHGLPY